jgi:ribosome-binding factor A
MKERRINRLQEQIKELLAEILQREIADPKLGLVTITRIELDPEFTQCKAFWSVIGDANARRDSEGALRRARGFCQRALGKSLHTRTTPHLEFVHDAGIAGAIRMTDLLKELREEREQKEREQPPAPEKPDAPGE